MSDLLTFPEASRELPGKPHVSTIHRWRLSGVRGIKLETKMIGGRRYVSRDSLNRFISQTTAAADGRPVPVRSDKQRARAIDSAEKYLDDLGI